VATQIVIGLSAVVIAIRDGEAVALTVRPRDDGHRTFEIALREFVTRQTRFELGFVEQLYTFGDKGREAPLADVGAGAARVISVGYLALAPLALETDAPGSAWSPFFDFFPWEDWRRGRPDVIDDAIAPALSAWAGRSESRLARARLLFALDGSPWNEERVLERYELLYEAALAPEAARDRSRALGGEPAEPAAIGLGEPMISDHRRILATGLGRLRGKLKYRPVIFELMSEAFTLSALQRTVEAISGVALHKQNFRRVVERTGLVEGLGQMDVETGGRPAELFRFRRELLTARPASGLSLPLLRD
jgi:hypothetical protein